MHDFRVWAPNVTKIAVQVGETQYPMEGPDARGYWCVCVDCAADADYGFRLDDDATLYPDPRSLRQPNGVHGASRPYDHTAFAWTDGNWRGNSLTGSILYEMHVGTFSTEGTFDGAVAHLDHLAELGVTHLALMPVAEFAGNRGWGYDGVGLYSVFEPYGGPDGLKRFVDACHARGLAVVMDVVYNHFGPVGNYTTKFGPYLNEKHRTPWGAAVNFEEGGSDEVRRFFIDNAIMWMQDYHMDGLRLDAVHEFYDRSAVHFMEQLSFEVSRLATQLGRNLFLIAESDLNDPKVVRPREAGGYGMDAQWSDDFHHALFTLLYTKEPGRGYYDDFGKMEYLEKALRRAFVFDGQYSQYRLRKHGRPIDNLSAHHFIHFDQNHDQVGNRAFGERLEHLVGMDAAKVSMGLVLLAPYVPMLFMGEEFAASSPFLYFADHEEEEMRRLVAEGRKKEFSAFGYDGAADILNPEEEETFQKSKLKWDEASAGKHAEMLEWTRALIKLRRSTVALNDGDMSRIDAHADAKTRTLVMTRDEARVLANLSEMEATFDLLEHEELRLASKDGVTVVGDKIVLPAMSLAALQRPREDIR